MPIVIYGVSVTGDETMVHPQVFYANSSKTPVKVANYQLIPNTDAGALWVDDYETVPGQSKQNNTLGTGWKDPAVTCVRIKEANIEVDGQTLRFTIDNIEHLFQDHTLNTCE